MKIDIKGPIISNSDQWIYDWLGREATSPQKVLNLINKAENNEDLELSINSGGGSVFDASEIYTALKKYPGQVKGEIVGIAASAASTLAMACDHLSMAPTGQMMIHNASVRAQGDYRDMQHTSNFLKNVNQTIASAYKLKSGKEYEELLSMMDAETWLTPQMAKEHKLIDAIMFEEEVPELVASADSAMLPKDVIEKIRNEFNPQHQVTNNMTQVKEPPVSSEPNNQDKGDKTMTLEELKNAHPELFSEVQNLGAKAERERIQNIEELAVPGHEDLINKAKFETAITAEQVAVQMIKADKEKGTAQLQNLKNDAADLNTLTPSPGNAGDPKATADDDREGAVNFMSEHIKNLRGGK